MKRMRGRNHRPGGGGGGFRNQQNGIPLNRNHVFDSSGPEMRLRGTAQQLYDKYTQLARDAASSADRVLCEAHYQHAEHYFRVLSAINAAQGLPPPGQNGDMRHNNGQPQGEPQRAEPAAEGHDMAELRDSRPDRQENREARDNREQNTGHHRQERRFEPRQRQDFQPRERKEFQPRERQEHSYRPTPEVADIPIDISSALEAELRATIREEPREIAVESSASKWQAPSGQHEPRAIPITPDAPPPALALTEPAAAPKRRGRPPRSKADETT